MPSGDLMPSGTPIPPEDTIKEEEEGEEQYLVKNSGSALLQGWILPAFAAPPARHHVQRRSAPGGGALMRLFLQGAFQR